MNKMPYISDKQLYAAVMYCCKLVREYHKDFNTAVGIAARTYHRDYDEVQREMAKRSGSKYSGAEKGKMGYFGVVTIFYDRSERPHYKNRGVRRGYNATGIERKLEKLDRANFYEGMLDWEISERFETEAEAEEWLKLKDEQWKECV